MNHSRNWEFDEGGWGVLRGNIFMYTYSQMKENSTLVLNDEWELRASINNPSSVTEQSNFASMNRSGTAWFGGSRSALVIHLSHHVVLRGIMIMSRIRRALQGGNVDIERSVGDGWEFGKVWTQRMGMRELLLPLLRSNCQENRCAVTYPSNRNSEWQSATTDPRTVKLYPFSCSSLHRFGKFFYASIKLRNIYITKDRNLTLL